MTEILLRTPVTIWSEGSRLAGQVVRPARGEASLRPAILLCHGWGGLKEHLLERYADFFAEAGYVVLAFDYRGWGGSDGKLIPAAGSPMLLQAGEQTLPATVLREIVDPLDQIADIRACLAWLLSEPGVDPERVGLWGSSYGGGHVVVVAASDDRPKAVVAQIGGFGVPGRPDWTDVARERAVDKARARIEPPMPQAGNAEATPGLSGSPDVARMLEHRPMQAAETLRTPTLFIDAEREEYAPPGTHGLIVEVAGRNAAVDRTLHAGTHYEVYDKFLEPARQEALDWFNTHLGRGA